MTSFDNSVVGKTLRIAAEREALCKSCQECCKHLLIPTAFSADDRVSMGFFNARGFQLIDYKGHLAIVMDHVCPHLTAEGCNIYKTRPYACRIYDGRNDPLMKNKCKWTLLTDSSIFELSPTK